MVKKKKKKLGEKLVKMLGFCLYRIFGQKFDFWNGVYYEEYILGAKIQIFLKYLKIDFAFFL